MDVTLIYGVYTFNHTIGTSLVEARYRYIAELTSNQQM